jgi:receptor protein-tyrosine kinase
VIERSEAPPRRALAVIRRRAPLVILCALIAAGAALGLSLLQTKQYEADATLLFRDPGFDRSLFGGTFLSEDPTRAAATNVELVSLSVVADRTATRLGGDFTGDDIQSKVDVTNNGRSDLVEVAATDTDPRLAAQIANAFAAEFVSFRRHADRQKVRQARKLVEDDLARLPSDERHSSVGRQLERQVNHLTTLEAVQTGNAELVDPADVPESPASPKPVRNAVIGGLFGLLLGIGIAALFERSDRRLRDPREFEEVYDLPVLTTVSEDRALEVSSNGSRAFEPGTREAFQMLRTRLRYFNIEHDIRSVLVTSASPGDGKTTIALNLAAGVSAAGSRAALVEADFHHSNLAARVGAAPLPGLSEYLSNQSSLTGTVQRVAVTGGPSDNGASGAMNLMVAGSYPPNAAALLESERMRSLLKNLTASHDLVVIDTPPISRLADAIPLIRDVDGVIVVGRMGKTTEDEALDLAAQLRKLDARVLGIVVNRAPTRGPYAVYYGYQDNHDRQAFERHLVGDQSHS